MKGKLNIGLMALLMGLLLHGWAAKAQAPDSLFKRFDLYSALCSPEKVYLHFDRSCYTAGETIWFKGWAQEASLRSVLPPSNFLYAEVLDEKGETVAKVKIKRTGNAFPGCIQLPDNLETGYYTLRAYTLWQLNNHNEYLFNDRIRIVGTGVSKPDIPLDSNQDIEITFWPEGGRYFANRNAVVGFKVVDQNGKSVEFGGYLVNDIDDNRQPVATVHDGMGVISFVPRQGRNYSLLDALGNKYPLPGPSDDGATLNLKIRSGRYYVSALGFGGGVASLLVRDASELRPLADINLDGQEGTVMIEKSFFRPGINHFLLVNSNGQIMAERLFYIRDEAAPVCKLNMVQSSPDIRALVKGEVSLMNPDGTPLDGNFSVSVVRGALKDWQQSDGITSYMGLSSELKGRINKPYYYFDPEVPEQERDAALDILMMIQGWRYYDLEKIADVNGGNFKIRHIREQVQELRGRVTRGRSKKVPENYTFTFMIPNQNFTRWIEVERGKVFIIDSLDFHENTEMLINIGRKREEEQYLPKWDGDVAAEKYAYKPAPGFSRESRIASPVLTDAAPGDTLNAAVVTATYEGNDVLVFGRSLNRDLETFKDMTLLEYLSMTMAMFEYDGENMYNRNRRRGNSAADDSLTEDDDDETGKVLLIVEDNEEAWWGFDLIRLDDIRTLNISKYPDPVYGGDGGVVHITMKPGRLRRDEERNPSLLYFVPLGYQLPRYFDSPRYDLGDDRPYDVRNTIYWSPDIPLDGGRATIEFCNSDRKDYPYVVRIEGLSADGRPFSRHCTVF